MPVCIFCGERITYEYPCCIHCGRQIPELKRIELIENKNMVKIALRT